MKNFAHHYGSTAQPFAANANTRYEGMVKSTRNFIMIGETYSSQIYLGARDLSAKPEIYLTDNEPFYDSVVENGQTNYKLRSGVEYENLKIDNNGFASYSKLCSSVGNYNYGGLIHYVSNTGEQWLPFRSSYQVGQAGFTVSATKCNVLYRGLDNPVEVSVSGYPKELVNVGISGGATIRAAAGGGYIVNVAPGNTSREVILSISVKDGGNGKNIGSTKFRVLDVPPPTVRLGAYADGSRIPKSAITASPYLTARLEADFFPFEGIKYTVSSYDFIYSVRGVQKVVKVSGANLTAEVL